MVVSRVKRLLGARRVGHTGTLDPMATGVLPICVGEGTKLAGYLLADDKVYSGRFALGTTTSTYDAEGEVTGGDPGRAQSVTSAEVMGAVAALTGAIEQVPPMVSALKHQGRRLHQLAREGIEVEREPRAVTIERFTVEPSGNAGEWAFEVECSKGTYIRSLVHDLGANLGCGAHLTALRREVCGAFAAKDAISLADLTEERARECLRAPHEVELGLVSAQVPAALVPAVGCGKPMNTESLGIDWEDGAVGRLLGPGGVLLALVARRQSRIEYLRVFTYGLTNRA